MAITELKAGGKLDLLNRVELKETLRELMQEWRVDVARGARPISISTDAAPDQTTGVATLGGATTLTGGTLGPAPGFMWAVTRLAVRVDSQPAPFELYLDRASAQQLIRDVDGSQNGYTAFGTHELLVASSSGLVIRTAAIDVTKRVYVSGAAIEVPNQLMWKWLAG